jgi:hypothetical protein
LFGGEGVFVELNGPLLVPLVNREGRSLGSKVKPSNCILLAFSWAPVRIVIYSSRRHFFGTCIEMLNRVMIVTLSKDWMEVFNPEVPSAKFEPFLIDSF